MLCRSHIQVEHRQNDRVFFENSYNIVTIKDGKAAVDIKIVGGKRRSFVEVVEKYRPYLET